MSKGNEEHNKDTQQYFDETSSSYKRRSQRIKTSNFTNLYSANHKNVAQYFVVVVFLKVQDLADNNTIRPQI